MSTFITKMSEGGGLRLAIKDMIDMKGYPTTAGSRAVERTAQPAVRDAACLLAIRRAVEANEVKVVGRTNLHELAYGLSGINPWFGTPVNPLNPTLIPGGSSSGSAVAVANGDADVALGTDTGGSVRIPAACCGIAGLKTTWGRVPLEGVWPLAPSFDTVGPMARDVSGLVLGMQLLEPGFAEQELVPGRIGRLRLDADPSVDEAIDRAVRVAGFTLEDVHLHGWADADGAAAVLHSVEAWRIHAELAEGGGIGDDVAERIRRGKTTSQGEFDKAQRMRRHWRGMVDELFSRFPAIILPTLTADPVAAGDVHEMYTRIATRPVNLYGGPAVSVPIPRLGKHPVSLQVLGPYNSEEMILGVALRIEEALG